MIKLIKLIYINILNVLDLNKIIVARKNGVKSGSEVKSSFLIAIFIICAYFVYLIQKRLLIVLNVKSDLLIVNFVLSFIISFIIALKTMGENLFKEEDNDFLLSLPLTIKEYLISKIFKVYIKVFVYEFIINVIGLLVLGSKIAITEYLVLVMLIFSLFIPLIPVVLSSVISYWVLIFKKNKSIYKNVYWLLPLLLIFLGIVYIFNNMNYIDVVFILKRIFLLPFLYEIAVVNNNVLGLLIYIAITIVLFRVVLDWLSKKYMAISLKIKVIPDNGNFVFKRRKCFNRFGLVRKDFLLINNCKLYKNSTFIYNVLFSIVFFIILFVLKKYSFLEQINSSYYFKLFLPVVIAFGSSLGISTIYCISFEKKNIQMLLSMPISFKKILFDKELVDIISGSLFIIINMIITRLFIVMNMKIVLLTLCLSLGYLLVNSLFSLILDCLFVSPANLTDSYIFKERFLTIVPLLVGLGLFLLPLVFPIYKSYVVILLTILLIIIIVILAELLFILFFYKKLLKKIKKGQE